MIGTPLVDRTVVETATLASGFCPEPAGSCSSSTQIVVREFAGTVYVLVSEPPPTRRYSTETVASVAPGLAINTNRSKNAPVAPSARNHSRAGAVTPALSCPAPNGWPGRLRYIARSATIGAVAVITAETSVLASSGPMKSTGIVVRLCGGSV